jgi:uncharacterized protein
MKFSQEEIMFSATNPHEYHLILLPTEKCNFRCVYCYEDHTKGRMSAETVTAIQNFLSRQLPELSHLTIDWFGGEPLLGIKVIRAINGFVLNYIDQHSENTWFRSGMTTNAYLLKPDLFEELTELGVNQYQVTIDGPRDLHDTTRIQVNGSGSFDVIWDNLQSMKKSKHAFDVLLRVHITKSTLPRIQEIVDQITDEFGGDPRFKIFLKPVKNLGGDGAAFAAVESVEGGDALAAELESKLLARNSFWQPNAICHASKFNSILIRADGTIAKCTTALDDPMNNLGKILADGRLEMDRAKILNWSRGLFSMDEDELYCPLGGIHKCEGCGEPAVAA